MSTCQPNPAKFKITNWFIQILAISPIETSTTVSKVYAFFVLILTILIYIFEIRVRIMTKFSHELRSSKRTVFLGVTNTTIVAASNAIITIITICLSSSFRTNFQMEVDNINKILHQYVKAKIYTKQFYLHLIILHLYYFGLLLDDVITWFVVDAENSHLFTLYCLDDIYRYRISILVLYLYYFVRHLYQKIRGMNTVLVDAFEHTSPEDLQIPEIVSNLEKICEETSSFHISFKLIVDNFNKLFGWQLLLILLNYIFLFMMAYELGLRIMTYKTVDVTYHMSIWIIACMIYALVG